MSLQLRASSLRKKGFGERRCEEGSVSGRPLGTESEKFTSCTLHE